MNPRNNARNTASLRYSTKQWVLNAMYFDRFKVIYNKFMEYLPTYIHELSAQRQFRLMHAQPGSEIQRVLIKELVIGQPFIPDYPELLALNNQYNKLEEQYQNTQATLTKVMYDCDSPRVLVTLFKFALSSGPLIDGELDEVEQAVLKTLQDAYKNELATVKRYFILNSM